MLSALSVDNFTWGVRIKNVDGWPEWTFEAEIDWRTGRVQDLRVSPPTGARRNVRQPSQRDIRRVKDLAEAMCGHGTGTILDFVAAAVPEPRGSKRPRERARAITVMYLAALKQGYSPRRAISAVYGLRTDPDLDATEASSGERTIYSRTLERWLKEAHDGPLGPYSRERHTPRRWPARSRNFDKTKAQRLEPRRAPKWDVAQDTRRSGRGRESET